VLIWRGRCGKRRRASHDIYIYNIHSRQQVEVYYNNNNIKYTYYTYITCIVRIASEPNPREPCPSLCGSTRSPSNYSCLPPTFPPLIPAPGASGLCTVQHISRYIRSSSFPLYLVYNIQKILLNRRGHGIYEMIHLN
jgi:hypothetical protein